MQKTGDNNLKKLYLISAIAFAVIYSLNCFAISPLITVVTADVLLSDTAIPTLLGYAHELLELVTVSFFYAVLILSIYRLGAKKSWILFIIFASATLYKYSANMAVTWADGGKIPSSWGWDVADIAFWTLLEFIQLLIVYFSCKRVIERFTDKQLVRKRALSRVGNEEGESVSEAYPFERVFDLKNCLLLSAFIAAAVTLAAKLSGALVSDVWLIAVAGAPKESMTWLLMILNYVTKAIMSVISYIVIFITMHFATRKF